MKDDPDADGDAADPTRVEAPAALRRQDGPTERRTQPPGAGSVSDQSAAVTRAETTTTPVEVLHAEEIARTVVFLRIVLGIAAVVGLALPMVGGDPAAKWGVAGGLVLCLASAGWLLLAIRDPARYTEANVSVVALCCVAGAYTGVYFWGIFSPAPALVLMGIYFFGLGRSFRATLMVYLTCASAQALMTGLQLSGLVAERGLIRADRLTWTEQLVTQLIVQMLFTAAFLIARSSRRTTLNAITQLEHAIRGVAQREALLHEARQELDRALRVGGPGRFSEQTLGSFRLGAVIGRGAMGEVYEAVHRATGEPAAVKLLHASVNARPDHVARFVREAKAAATLAVPNVVRVLEIAEPQAPTPYLAMERLHGHDLGHHLRKRRRLAIDKVLELVGQVGAGIAAAGAAGIVHRDLKPQNLFLAEQPAGPPLWKVLDFGVSTLSDHHGTLTHGQVVGTPSYMAPEQARGETVDHRADLYALAAIAYRALTGHPPFAGKDVPTILFDVVYKMPTRPGELVELPGEVDAVLAVALAKRREDRFASAGALAEALAQAARGELAPGLRRRALALLERLPWGGQLAG